MPSRHLFQQPEAGLDHIDVHNIKSFSWLKVLLLLDDYVDLQFTILVKWKEQTLKVVKLLSVQTQNLIQATTMAVYVSSVLLVQLKYEIAFSFSKKLINK